MWVGVSVLAVGEDVTVSRAGVLASAVGEGDAFPPHAVANPRTISRVKAILQFFLSTGLILPAELLRSSLFLYVKSYAFHI
jgi:hypothetical protein